MHLAARRASAVRSTAWQRDLGSRRCGLVAAAAAVRASTPRSAAETTAPSRIGECYAALSGLWSCLDAHWLNDPGARRDRLAQGVAAQARRLALGLRDAAHAASPTTRRAAAAFAEAEGSAGIIYKSFSAHRASVAGNAAAARRRSARLLDHVRFAPVIFQEHVQAEIDLRVTIVGDLVFAAEIASGETAYRVDYRMTMDKAAMRPHELPEALQAQLLAFMGELGLIYGAIDLRLTPTGDYVFLEVNPAGQWLFIEERTGLPITEAVAARLIALDGA